MANLALPSVELTDEWTVTAGDAASAGTVPLVSPAATIVASRVMFRWRHGPVMSSSSLRPDWGADPESCSDDRHPVMAVNDNRAIRAPPARLAVPDEALHHRRLRRPSGQRWRGGHRPSRERCAAPAAAMRLTQRTSKRQLSRP